MLRDELARIAEDGISDDELARGKGQLRGGLVLGLEDSGARMSRIAKAELLHDELLPIDEVVARIEAVTVDEVPCAREELFARPATLAIVGPDGPVAAEAPSLGWLSVPATSQAVKVAVLGSRGKVGRVICDAIEDADDLELVAEVDAGDDIEALVTAGAQVVVDFTHPDVVMDNLEFCIDHGIHCCRRHHRLRRATGSISSATWLEAVARDAACSSPRTSPSAPS